MKICFWIVQVTLGLLLLSSCASHNSINNIKDKEDFGVANQVHTIEAYQQYLLQHKNGQYVDSARNYIKQIHTKQIYTDTEKMKEKIRIESLEKEKDDFYKAKSIDSVTAYKEYLRQYPQGEFVNTVVELLSALEQREEQERIRRDEYIKDKTAFEQAKAENNRKSYQLYLSNFPRGSFVDIAYESIEKITNKEAQERARRKKEQRDMELFNLAKTENSIKAYKKYLDLSPRGKFVSDARNSIKLIIEKEKEQKKKDKLQRDSKMFSEAKNINTMKSYQNYLKHFPQGKYSGEAKREIVNIEERSKKTKTLKGFMDALISPIE